MPLLTITRAKSLKKLLLRTMKQSKKCQVKSKFYYIFWGTATLAVVLGQLYVGTGYRVLHNDMQQLLNNVDGVLLHKGDEPNYL